MQPIPLADIYVSGELRERILRNLWRLEERDYQPEAFQTTSNKGWPGDREGRLILGLVLLAQAAHRRARRFDELLQMLLVKMEGRGFLGEPLPRDVHDEQYLAGHSWVVHALCEYLSWKRDPAVSQALSRLCNSLFAHATEAYGRYPISASERLFAGEAAGSSTGETHAGWRTSTDTGCAFIALDGAAHAYQLLCEQPMRRLVEAIAARLDQTDVAGIGLQTHATLSAVRGLLRFHDTVASQSFLNGAGRIYALYRSQAMTENYANYNWFGRASWTEPCAIVDSFIAATELWKHTHKPGYLDDAHHIFYNGFGYGQRPNGGWGCDCCVGAKDVFLHPADAGAYEAHWCCSMRGGEGLARAATYTYFLAGDQVYLPFYHDSTARLRFDDGEVIVEQRTEYPRAGRVALDILHSTIETPKTLLCYLPCFTDRSTATFHLNGSDAPRSQPKRGLLALECALRRGDLIEFTFDIGGLREAPPVNPSTIPAVRSFRHGPLVLGITAGVSATTIEGVATLTPIGNAHYMLDDGRELAPINDMIHKSTYDAMRDRRQVLFPRG